MYFPIFYYFCLTKNSNMRQLKLENNKGWQSVSFPLLFIKNKTWYFACLIILLFLASCGNKKSDNESVSDSIATQSGTFKFQTEQFADLKILRYQVPGFEDLS